MHDADWSVLTLDFTALCLTLATALRLEVSCVLRLVTDEVTLSPSITTMVPSLWSKTFSACPDFPAACSTSARDPLCDQLMAVYSDFPVSTCCLRKLASILFRRGHTRVVRRVQQIIGKV